MKQHLSKFGALAIIFLLTVGAVIISHPSTEQNTFNGPITLSNTGTTSVLAVSGSGVGRLHFSTNIVETLGVNSNQSPYELTLFNDTVGNGANVLSLVNTSSNGYDAITFKDYHLGDRAAFGIGNHAASIPQFQDTMYLELTGSGSSNALPFMIVFDDGHSNITTNGPSVIFPSYPSYGSMTMGGYGDTNLQMMRKTTGNYNFFSLNTGPVNLNGSGVTLDFAIYEPAGGTAVKFGTSGNGFNELTISGSSVQMGNGLAVTGTTTTGTLRLNGTNVSVRALTISGTTYNVLTAP